MLESFVHEESCFVTLTYDPQKYNGDSLVPEHCTKWLKRLRKALGDKKIRYFLVGEYGDHTQRPHYHAAIFGIGPSYEDLVLSSWNMGHVYVGDLSPHSARYITGYVVKKMTAKTDDRLSGRYPEFARMSKGIGRDAIPALAEAVKPYIEATEDVPTFVRAGSKTMPLGRYLRARIRKELDIHSVDPETGEVKYGQTKKAAESSLKELQALHADWFSNSKESKISFLDFLKSLDDGKVALMETRISHRGLRRKL